MKAPKETEDRLNKILCAWRKDAADKTFGGMSLTQFETEIAVLYGAPKSGGHRRTESARD